MSDTKHLISYAGFWAGVHDSGEWYSTGHITKIGQRDLRQAMLEAANSAKHSHPYWKKGR